MINEELIFNQFRMWRGWSVNGLKKVPADTVGLIPSGFSNNIHWNAGHILIGWDHGIFSSLGLERRLPKEYHLMFPNGSSPKGWEQEPPGFEEIINKFDTQTDEIIEICRGHLDDTLKKPFLHMTTLGEMFLFLISHESLHMGVVKGINYAINK